MSEKCTIVILVILVFLIHISPFRRLLVTGQLTISEVGVGIMCLHYKERWVSLGSKRQTGVFRPNKGLYKHNLNPFFLIRGIGHLTITPKGHDLIHVIFTVLGPVAK